MDRRGAAIFTVASTSSGAARERLGLRRLIVADDGSIPADEVARLGGVLSGFPDLAREDFACASVLATHDLAHS